MRFMRRKRRTRLAINWISQKAAQCHSTKAAGATSQHLTPTDWSRQIILASFTVQFHFKSTGKASLTHRPNQSGTHRKKVYHRCAYRRTTRRFQPRRSQLSRGQMMYPCANRHRKVDQLTCRKCTTSRHRVQSFV